MLTFNLWIHHMIISKSVKFGVITNYSSVVWRLCFNTSIIKFDYFKHIQSSAIITQYNIIRYNIDNYKKCGRTSIRHWINKWHPIPRPNGWDMGCTMYVHVYIWCTCCQNKDTSIEFLQEILIIFPRHVPSLIWGLGKMTFSAIYMKLKKHMMC